VSPDAGQMQDLGHHQEHDEAAIGVQGSETSPGRFDFSAHGTIMSAHVAVGKRAMRDFAKWDYPPNTRLNLEKTARACASIWVSLKLNRHRPWSGSSCRRFHAGCAL